MSAIMELLGSWDTVKLFLGVAFLLGFAPGAALRLILLIYPSDHPRRRELIGELYAMRRLERPFFVFEQLELALFEGLPLRRAERRAQTARRRRGEWAAQLSPARSVLKVALGLVIVAGGAVLNAFNASLWIAIPVMFVGVVVAFGRVIVIEREVTALEEEAAVGRQPTRP
jgi:hypothetical protein